MFGLSSHSSHHRRRSSSRNFTPVIQCSVGRDQEMAHSRTPSLAGGVGAALLAFPSFSSLFVNPFKNIQESMSHDVRTVGAELNIKPVYFLVTLVLVVGFSTVMTLMFSTSGVTQGYVLRDLQAKRQALVIENEKVTMSIASAQSLQAVVTNDVIRYMHPATKITYLHANAEVAMK
ncbi:MAG: hypothetical protein NTX63_02620 [Candidatus Peregrinibacteria bacterium]|nr:hypothetical protein [Candidatus Peregrinibacteria bacterium]